jgi:hypothetical protein
MHGIRAAETRKSLTFKEISLKAVKNQKIQNCQNGLY